MSQPDGLSLLLGLMLLGLVSYGLLTGGSTTRSSASFAKNPAIWSIGIGMQAFIALYCFMRSEFISKHLGIEWLHQAITSDSGTNRELFAVIFVTGSFICGAFCFLARNLFLALSTARQGENLSLQTKPLPRPQSIGDGAALNENDSVQSQYLTQVSYSKSDRMFYGILSLFASGLCLMMSYSTIYSFPWQSHWSTTTGIVKEISRNGKVQNVEYSYSADNRNFVAKEQFHWHGNLLHPGDQVIVRYDPVVVAYSAIQTGPTTATGLWIVASFFTLIAAIGQFKAPTGPAIGMKLRLY
jgi:hypothetical protein